MEKHQLIEYQKALHNLESGDVISAFEILCKLAEDNSRLWQVYHTLAGIALQQEDLDAACEMLHLAVKQPHVPESVIRQLASLTAAQGDIPSALAQLSPLIRSNPANADVLALVREIIGRASNLPPVAWARLVVDLRNPTPEQREQARKFEDLRSEVQRLENENRRLSTLLRTIKEEFRQTLSTSQTGDTNDTWEIIHKLDDKAWLEALIRSVDIPSFHGFPMAGFPPESIQVGMVGSSNQQALQEGFNFYRAVRETCLEHGEKWTGKGHLLDFGTGWGRYARIFMKDFRPENVTGVDVDAKYIQICRDTFPYGTFKTVNPLPPTELINSSFDLIIAYSVFSHLSEHVANAWIMEFSRILKPGGIVAITTQGRSLLQVCEQLREQDVYDHPWHQNLARSFLDREACEAAYDRGEFLYSATGGGDVRTPELYGEALIPPGYVERNWCKNFELLSFIDDRSYLPQALIVLRKKR